MVWQFFLLPRSSKRSNQDGPTKLKLASGTKRPNIHHKILNALERIEAMTRQK